MAPLREALAAGRIYDAEAWVAAGNPLQFAYSADRRRSPTSPLQVAIWSRGHDAVLLLLCNGYRTELERRSPLTEALRARRLDLVRLLLEWGTDVHDADVGEVVTCYDVGTIEEFWRRGLDFSKGGELASAVASGTRNKPLYGFLKRRAREDPVLQRELDRGLCFAVERRSRTEGDTGVKAVQLCLWAGADPWHAVQFPWGGEATEDDRLSVLASAAGHAVLHRDMDALAALRLRGDTPAFQSLYTIVRDLRTFEALVAIAPPQQLDALAVDCIEHLAMTVTVGHSPDTSMLRRVFALGGKVRALSDLTVRRLRDGMRKHSAFGREIVSLLQRPEHAERAVILRLIATPTILRVHLSYCIRLTTLREFIDWPDAPRVARAAARRALRRATVREPRWEDD